MPGDCRPTSCAQFSAAHTTTGSFLKQTPLQNPSFPIFAPNSLVNEYFRTAEERPSSWLERLSTGGLSV